MAAINTAPSAIALRLMTEQDIPMLHAWLRRPHVAAWWSDGDELTLQATREIYRPPALASEGVTPYIGLLDGRPIGYAQSYVAAGSGDGWWQDITDPGVRGIDQFLSETELLGRGLGTRFVMALVELLFHDPAVTMIQTDPDPNNARAIRCYEKAGFQAIRTVVTPDGPALYMCLQRKP